MADARSFGDLTGLRLRRSRNFASGVRWRVVLNPHDFHRSQLRIVSLDLVELRKRLRVHRFLKSRFAGVAQWSGTRAPSWRCGFDSRHPRQRSTGPHGEGTAPQTREARFDPEVDLIFAAFDFREVVGFSIQPGGFDTPTRYCLPRLRFR